EESKSRLHPQRLLCGSGSLHGSLVLLRCGVGGLELLEDVPQALIQLLGALEVHTKASADYKVRLYLTAGSGAESVDSHRNVDDSVQMATRHDVVYKTNWDVHWIRNWNLNFRRFGHASSRLSGARKSLECLHMVATIGYNPLIKDFVAPF